MVVELNARAIPYLLFTFVVTRTCTREFAGYGGFAKNLNPIGVVNIVPLSGAPVSGLVTRIFAVVMVAGSMSWENLYSITKLVHAC
jgi:hypothetical protein